jgi:hypothetical protein
MALEALALRARMPQVRLDRLSAPDDAVGPLLSLQTIDDLRVIPIVVRRGTVALASPRVHGPESIARLEQEIGFPVTRCLCAPSAFRAACLGSTGSGAARRCRHSAAAADGRRQYRRDGSCAATSGRMTLSA